MDAAKASFLRHRFLILLKQLPTDSAPRWGKFTLQQMIEHFTDAVRVASGQKVFTEVLTPPEQLPRMQAFLLSDKPFRENTASPLLSELPPPVVNPSVEAALEELAAAIAQFFRHFEAHPNATTRNPIFGDLNAEENVALLYKHALHHLRQFGITLQNETNT
jgi:hypothetical protein